MMKIVIHRALKFSKRIAKPFFNNLILRWTVVSDEQEIIKTLRFCSFLVLKQVINATSYRLYLIGKLIKTTNFDSAYDSSMLHTYNIYAKESGKDIKDYSDIVVLHSNSGEAYIFLTYVLEAFIERYNCKDILFILTKRYHIDLLEAIHPSLPYVFIPYAKVPSILVKQTDRYRIFTILEDRYYIRFESMLRDGKNIHCLCEILKHLGIASLKLTFTPLNICDAHEKSLLTKVSKISLNLNNFVFMTPEADSCVSIESSFWQALIEALQAKGIDIFVNLMDSKTKKMLKGCIYKTCSLTFSEAILLSRKAKSIVSLRSGLVESLTQSNVPLFSLCTNLKNRGWLQKVDSKHVLNGFSLKAFPFVRQSFITEIDMSAVSTKKLISNIVDTALAKKASI
ncbi:hypothetical protein [Helicobacter sp. 11S02629-2]|uniref:hypothetical protein n=1 Tax=Helicobacter sp. 11S02629-2 TaxID=1476195 RepID=UPI000BA4EE82|nr:hypothetical protein [Helicobacter sp. 11S02629-2]PAF44661.1 hypothetical protein BKH40_05385 [Helicobacter sp. 11S02629-2]